LSETEKGSGKETHFSLGSEISTSSNIISIYWDRSFVIQPLFI